MLRDAEKAKDAYDQLIEKGRKYREYLGKFDQEMRMRFTSEGGVTFTRAEKSP